MLDIICGGMSTKEGADGCHEWWQRFGSQWPGISG